MGDLPTFGRQAARAKPAGYGGVPRAATAVERGPVASYPGSPWAFAGSVDGDRVAGKACEAGHDDRCGG